MVMGFVGALYERTGFRLDECAVIDRTYTSTAALSETTPRTASIVAWLLETTGTPNLSRKGAIAPIACQFVHERKMLSASTPSI